MKKRVFIRIICFLVAVIFVSFGFILTLFKQKQSLQSRIEDEYFNSINETATKISEINYNLKKQLYCNSSAMKTNYCTKICETASSAKECLARLPIEEQNAENIYKYLSQVADYSRAMLITKNSVKSNAGLKKLIDYSDNLCDSFSTLQGKIKNTTDFDSDIKNMLNNTAEKTSFSGEIKNLSQATKAFPTLIYDGPFSEHILRAKPQLLKGKSKIGKEEANKKAKAILCENDIKYTGKENSNIKSYTFSGKSGGVCAITELGGYCLYLNKTSGEEDNNINKNVAISNAKNYLKTLYDTDFIESYFEKHDNIITINFAAYQNGVTLYSDLIKVGVSLSNGKILSVEARGFLMNHHKRKIPKFTQKSEKIKNAVSKELTVKSIKKSLILSDSLKEKYCYEIKCKTKDKQDVLVYLNKDTLDEENVLFLIHSSNGTLTK